MIEGAIELNNAIEWLITTGNHDMFRQCELGLAEFHKTAQARFKKNNPLSNLVIPKVVSFFNISHRY